MASIVHLASRCRAPNSVHSRQIARQAETAAGERRCARADAARACRRTTRNLALVDVGMLGHRRTRRRGPAMFTIFPLWSAIMSSACSTSVIDSSSRSASSSASAARRDARVIAAGGRSSMMRLNSSSRARCSARRRTRVRVGYGGPTAPYRATARELNVGARFRSSPIRIVLVRARRRAPTGSAECRWKSPVATRSRVPPSRRESDTPLARRDVPAAHFDCRLRHVVPANVLVEAREHIHRSIPRQHARRGHCAWRATRCRSFRGWLGCSPATHSTIR